MDTRYINQIEVLVNLFTIDNGKLKILLFRKLEDPYKGYWMLPSNLLMTSETIEECAEATMDEMAGLKDIFMKQCNVFSKIDRLPNERILANSLIAIIDKESLTMKREPRKYYESAWFSIEEVPKMVYDHGMILEDSINYLRHELNNVEILKILFPSDFTLPELQVVYEQVLNTKLDRRNFRKKLVNLGLIIDTGYKTGGKTGRPAILYRFSSEKTKNQLFELQILT